MTRLTEVGLAPGPGVLGQADENQIPRFGARERGEKAEESVSTEPCRSQPQETQSRTERQPTTAWVPWSSLEACDIGQFSQLETRGVLEFRVREVLSCPSAEGLEAVIAFSAGSAIQSLQNFPPLGKLAGQREN